MLSTLLPELSIEPITPRNLSLIPFRLLSKPFVSRLSSIVNALISAMFNLPIQICKRLIYNYVMQSLCTKCHYIGRPSEEESDIKLAEIVFWTVAILGIIIGFFNLIVMILALFWLGFAVFYSIIRRKFKSKKCPKCDNNSFIPLDTPRAQELIKTHNLVIPKESIETSKPKAPWQTS